jgi:hypothetical protein
MAGVGRKDGLTVDRSDAVGRSARTAAQEPAHSGGNSRTGCDQERPMTDAYTLLKTLHILSATVLLGTAS